MRAAETARQILAATGVSHILTTMAFPVIDCVEVSSARDAQLRFFFVSSDDHLLQMDDDEARRFYAAHAVHIQHVSEILITKGFW